MVTDIRHIALASKTSSAISGLQECYIKIEQYYINVQIRYEDKVAVNAVNILYFITLIMCGLF